MSSNNDEKNEKSLFTIIEGLTRLDPALLAEFKDEMTREVIPEIVKVVEERQLLAAESREKQLKC